MKFKLMRNIPKEKKLKTVLKNDFNKLAKEIKKMIPGKRKESTDEKTSLNDALRTFGVEV